MPLTFINWEKSLLCRSSCWSTGVIGALIVCASRKSRAFIYAYTRNAQHVLCALWFWRSLFMPCWLVINGIYDRLASNQKHPFIVCMNLSLFPDPLLSLHKLFLQPISMLFHRYVPKRSPKECSHSSI